MSTQSKRILALDILRGITIAGMILVNNPGSWSHVYAPLRHAEWNGLTPTDLVFPFFMFMMGISTYISLSKYQFAYSHASAWKIVRRTAVIWFIGLAINWFAHFCSYWAGAPHELGFGSRLFEATFNFSHLRIMGVMARLAICYGIASLVALTVKHSRIPLLIGGLLASYLVVLWQGQGFAYDGEVNLIAVLDRAILGSAHMYNDHGIDPEGILSTLPAIAHVLIGFCVGRAMLTKASDREASRAEVLRSHLLTLFIVGTLLTFAGLLFSYGCPLNKKVWSPTFVLATCGMACSLLALLIWTIDLREKKRWCRFFEVFGVNPLFLYVLAAVLSIVFSTVTLPWEGGSISIQSLIYDVCLTPLFGHTGGSLAYALLFIVLNWMIGYPLYRRRIYIKI